MRGLEELLPLLEELHVVLALENLPSWEALLTEVEFERLFDRMDSPFIRHWHDIGHGRIRENLGLTHTERWLERLAPYLAGFHVHDVAPPARDHLMPPLGEIDFSLYRPYALRDDVLTVLEPAPGTPADRIRDGVALLERAWQDAPPLPRFPRPGQPETGA
jgi:sugar phosphate isomerase/epimerase